MHKRTYDEAFVKEETISIADENGKVYEFEKPRFNCWLLKVVPNGIIACVEDNGMQPVKISFNGNMEETDGTTYGLFLQPIKTKWYEDDNNFPALVWDNTMGYFDLLDFKSQLHKQHRLATKEEVESLYYEGK